VGEEVVEAQQVSIVRLLLSSIISCSLLQAHVVNGSLTTFGSSNWMCGMGVSAVQRRNEGQMLSI
jgi:hypothetical protein